MFVGGQLPVVLNDMRFFLNFNEGSCSALAPMGGQYISVTSIDNSPFGCAVMLQCHSVLCMAMQMMKQMCLGRLTTRLH